MSTVRKNFDRNELRRDRRHPLPPLTVALGPDTYTTVNWSLGGFLLADAPAHAVGVQIEGALRIDGGSQDHSFTAEILRHDDNAVAFRFVDRTESMVGALDRALAGRMIGRRAGRASPAALLGILALAFGLSFASPARADAPLVGSGTLVRGGASLPQFGGNFPMDFGSPELPPPPATTLQTVIAAPESGDWLHFLFTPQTLSGQSFGFRASSNGSYAGLGWNMFQASRLYGAITFSGAVNPQAAADPTRRLYGPLLSLHSTIELGYDVGAQQNLSLALDHAQPAPLAGDRNAFGEYLRLQYGYHF